MKKRRVLKTKRLILRPFKLSDAKSVQQKAGKKEIAKTTLNIPHPYPDGVAEEWISTHQSKFESGELVNYAITLKETGELIGAVGLVVTKKFNHAELGYWIDKSYWGEGYATEAAKALLDYGFNTHKLYKIFAELMTKNPASGKVVKKLGMKKEGLFKGHVLKANRYEDIVMYGILKTEWSKKRRQNKYIT
jgi:[ribosomal protein S5]-alanine N-acetyltransferase